MLNQLALYANAILITRTSPIFIIAFSFDWRLFAPNESDRFAFAVFNDLPPDHYDDPSSTLESPLSIVPDETSFMLQTDHPIGTFSRPIDFPVEAHALFCPRLRQGGCGCNHGFQYTRHHGQGRTEEADREHEVPGVHGTVAPVQEHRGVSASRRQPNRRFIVICCLSSFLLACALLFTNLSENTRENVAHLQT